MSVCSVPTVVKDLFEDGEAENAASNNSRGGIGINRRVQFLRQRGSRRLRACILLEHDNGNGVPSTTECCVCCWRCCGDTNSRVGREEGRRWILCHPVISGLSVLLLALAVVYASLRLTEERPAEQNNEQHQDDTPFRTVSESSVGPSSSPTTTVGEMTPPALSFPLSSRGEAIREMLFTLVTEDGVLLDIAGTPQHDAFSWIVYDDPMKLESFDHHNLAQRFALATLFFSSTGNKWFNNTNWLTGQHECSWHGVMCSNDERLRKSITGRAYVASIDDDMLGAGVFHEEDFLLQTNTPPSFSRASSLGEVISLDLTGNNVVGSITNEIGALTTLRGLFLGSNLLGSCIPSTIGQLVLLESLFLDHNFLNCTLPAEVTNLTSLQKLYINHNNISGPILDNIGRLVELEELALNNNAIKGTIAESIGYLTQLRVLLLSFNELTGFIPTSLGNLFSLSMLQISSNDLRGTVPEAVCALTNADFSKNEFWKSLPEVRCTCCGQPRNATIEFSDDASSTSTRIEMTLLPTIHGENDHDLVGAAVSLSGSGTRMAVGGASREGDTVQNGNIRLYEFNEEAIFWEEMLFLVEDVEVASVEGFSVSLSGDGNHLAIGFMGLEGSDILSGYVRLFGYDFPYWKQIGEDIKGNAEHIWFGFSTSLSTDGSVVATGDPKFGAGKGSMSLYHYHHGNWKQMGELIEGTKGQGHFGWCVCLSANGKFVAAGAPNTATRATSKGYVSVYSRGENGWVQQGDEIGRTDMGDVGDDMFGYSVSLSSNGIFLAVGAPQSDVNGSRRGSTRIYQYDQGLWKQHGKSIDGVSDGDNAGWSVALSSNGRTVIIGAPQKGFISMLARKSEGYAKIFEFRNGTWTQLWPTVNGTEPRDAAGFSVSISSRGNIVAIGAPMMFDGSGRGYVQTVRTLND